MELKNRAMTEKKKRTRGISVIVFLGCVGCAALVLAVLNIFKHHYIYAAAYLAACVLSAMYTVMKINTVLPSFVGNDEEKIYMCTWENGFFPFRTDKGFFGEFLPEKTETVKLPLDGIKSIYIGTANFVSRNLPESAFAAKAKEYKAKYSGTLRRMEFIHIVLNDGTERYMPVTDFDPEALAQTVKAVQSVNKNMIFSTGNRKIRRHVPEINPGFGM